MSSPSWQIRNTIWWFKIQQEDRDWLVVMVDGDAWGGRPALSLRLFLWLLSSSVSLCAVNRLVRQKAELCKHASGMRFLSTTSHLFDPVLILLKAVLCYILRSCVIIVALFVRTTKAWSRPRFTPLFSILYIFCLFLSPSFSVFKLPFMFGFSSYLLLPPFPRAFLSLSLSVHLLFEDPNLVLLAPP